ncbi:hypothetical protein ABZ858_29945 [Streptomyces sp. NPDC047017]|uniref:hypothetical protein n=1 Tax=Streptomyces sp. NPDC047017 TaxID=3155024 RepID=UPI0033CCED56
MTPLVLAGMGVIIPATHCVQVATVADTIPVRVRYSGTSLITEPVPRSVMAQHP